MTGQTTVTQNELTEAQGGYAPVLDNSLVTVECPADYDLATITAEDILHDDEIVMVDQP
jgi:hypothetical protein